MFDRQLKLKKRNFNLYNFRDIDPIIARFGFNDRVTLRIVFLNLIFNLFLCISLHVFLLWLIPSPIFFLNSSFLTRTYYLFERQKDIFSFQIFHIVIVSVIKWLFNKYPNKQNTTRLCQETLGTIMYSNRWGRFYRSMNYSVCCSANCSLCYQPD